MTQIIRRGQRHNGFRLCVEIVAERASVGLQGTAKRIVYNDWRWLHDWQ